MTLRILLTALFYLTGSFLHELAHYIAALLLGKPEGFSLIPRKQGRRIIFGSVTASYTCKVYGSLIAAAPLIWWGVLYLILQHLGILQVFHGGPRFHLTVSTERTGKSLLYHLPFLWLALQLLWAGKLSSHDLREFVRGLLSPSGALLIVGVAVGVMVIGNY
ncbi:MAG: hypothetical protein IT388_03520 [Nitrospirales bacterium]|nr:hypothetical protein [Nitrospirales bacterium]